MRLIQQHEGVATDQPSLIRAHSARHAVPFEQQAGTDHVHGTDDDRWRPGVFKPLAVVHVLAAKRGDGQFSVGEPQVAANLFQHWGLQALAKLFREIGCLIDHRAPVHDIDEAAGQRGTSGAGQQPDSHYGGFAEPGRDIHGRGHVSVAQLAEQASLPRKRLVLRQRLERLIEIERAHSVSHVTKLRESSTINPTP